MSTYNNLKAGDSVRHKDYDWGTLTIKEVLSDSQILLEDGRQFNAGDFKKA